jgi:hypothetical protein
MPRTADFANTAYVVDTTDSVNMSVYILSHTDEGMTNGPPIFAYLVFGPGKVSLERLLKPIKATV